MGPPTPGISSKPAGLAYVALGETEKDPSTMTPTPRAMCLRATRRWDARAAQGSPNQTQAQRCCELPVPQLRLQPYRRRSSSGHQLLHLQEWRPVPTSSASLRQQHPFACDVSLRLCPFSFRAEQCLPARLTHTACMTDHHSSNPDNRNIARAIGCSFDSSPSYWQHASAYQSCAYP